MHYVDRFDVVAVGEIIRRISTNDNTYRVGTAYKVDQVTSLKANVDNHGSLAAVLMTRTVSLMLTSPCGSQANE
ncbi:hypothetical protein PTKIN_Ptkin14bG0036100 [Pterospermum kingtungense]